MLRMIRRGAVAALLVAAAIGAHAAGLGKLTVNSALGQILNAEIDLVSLQPGELDALTARVAPAEAFRDARIEYGSSLRLLRFSVEKRPNGQAYLKVTSVAPINEPFVDVLIEVTWPSGRVMREYPILLDPPGYAQARVTPPASAPATTPAPAAAAPTPAPASPSAEASRAPAASTASPGPSAKSEMAGSQAGADTYGPVQQGETLSKIANEVKPASVSLDQMLVALYRENKSAFVGENMNRLRAGQILKVPSSDEVGKLTTGEARKEVRTHVADWRTYREQLASGATTIPARTDTSNVAAGRVGSAAVAPPAPPAAEPKDVLKLSKAETGKAGTATKGGGASQDRLNALQEELIAKDRALKESQSRVADLERQIRDMQRLVELKAGAPAKPADPKVAAAPAPVPAKPEPVKPAEAPKAAPPPEVKTAEAPKPSEPAKVAEAPKTDTKEAPKPAPPKPAEAPKTPPKTAAKKAPPPRTFMDEVQDNLPLVVGGIAALGLLGFGGYMLAKRRRERAEAGPSSAMTSAFPSDLKPTTTTGKSGGGLVDTGNSSFLTDFDKTGPGTIDTDEVDPVAEAEVYIAYGRDAQAEEILKEAMARDRNRPEIPLKLLEIYHARKSATAFENVARDLKASVGEASPLWQKAAAMGAQIDPANPLYGGAGGASVAGAAAAGAAAGVAAAAAPAAKPDLDFDLDTSSSAGSSSAAAPRFDLDLDADKSSSAKDATLDFDLDSSPQASPASTASSEPAKPEPSFDFDLSALDMPASGKSSPDDKSQMQSTAAFNLTDLNLDESPAEAGGEAVGTKLELAKAYLEIGDKDGAREILQEVAKEGSSAQQEEAKKLIASL